MGFRDSGRCRLGGIGLRDLIPRAPPIRDLPWDLFAAGGQWPDRWGVPVPGDFMNAAGPDVLPITSPPSLLS